MSLTRNSRGTLRIRASWVWGTRVKPRTCGEGQEYGVWGRMGGKKNDVGNEGDRKYDVRQ